MILNVFHHFLLNRDEGLNESFRAAMATWEKKDGLPIVDYSSQEEGKRKGSHAETISTPSFKRFLRESRTFDFDLMLEIKDKEKSALKALKAASSDSRLVTG